MRKRPRTRLPVHLRGLTHRLRRGGAVLEFALSLPVLVTLLTGILDYGWFFHQRTALLDAAKDATRMGVAADRGENPVTSTETMARLILEDTGIGCSGGDCEVDVVAHTLDELHVITTTIRRTFEAPAGLVPAPAALEVSYTMLLEHQDPDYYGS